MAFDPKPWQADTPAASAGRIHLNNAGAALMPRPVLDAVQQHLLREAQLGGYEAADAVRADIDSTYDDVARLINARPRNIAVVENSTVAYSQALATFDFAPGDVILTTRNDYVSNQLAFLSLARRLRVDIVRAADLPEGGVDADHVRVLIRERPPRLVAVTWVPTNSGLVQPVQEIGRICADAGVPYLVDACQAVGQIPVDVATLHCDFLAATARKFLRGPRGVGFLYVSDRILERGGAPLFIDMRGAHWTDANAYRLADSARRYENWEFAFALHLGLGAAARYASRVGVAEAGAYAANLAQQARTQLQQLPGARILDRGRGLAAIATVTFDAHEATTIVERLREQAINTSATLRGSAVLDMDDKAARDALRISPHYYNTAREIETLVSALEEFASPT
jgi:selenocysteine lyase/cysteine desulfurase